MAPSNKQIITVQQEKIATVLKAGISTDDPKIERSIGDVIDKLAGMKLGAGETYLRKVSKDVDENVYDLEARLRGRRAHTAGLKVLQLQHQLLGENPSDAVLDGLITNKPMPGTWTEGSLADVLMHHDDGAWSASKASRAAKLVDDFSQRHGIRPSKTARQELIGMGFETEPLLCLLALELGDDLHGQDMTRALKDQEMQHDDWYNLPSAVRMISDHDFEPFPEHLEALAEIAAHALFQTRAIETYGALVRSGRVKVPILTLTSKGIVLSLMTNIPLLNAYFEALKAELYTKFADRLFFNRQETSSRMRCDVYELLRSVESSKKHFYMIQEDVYACTLNVAQDACLALRKSLKDTYSRVGTAQSPDFLRWLAAKLADILAQRRTQVIKYRFFLAQLALQLEGDLKLGSPTANPRQLWERYGEPSKVDGRTESTVFNKHPPKGINFLPSYTADEVIDSLKELHECVSWELYRTDSKGQKREVSVDPVTAIDQKKIKKDA